MKYTPFHKQSPGTAPAGASRAAPRANAPSVAVKITALVLCCVTAAGCGELRAASDAAKPPTVTVAGSPVPVPPGIGDGPRNFIQIGFDASVSGLKLRPELLRDLVQVVLPEAARRQAIVVTSVVGSNAFNAGANLEQVDFRAALTSETVDANTLTTTAFNEVVASLTRSLAGPPSGGSDPLGFLRRLADTRVQIPPTAHLLGVYLGDGGQSSPSCDLGLSPVTPDSALKATEQSCKSQ